MNLLIEGVQFLVLVSLSCGLHKVCSSVASKHLSTKVLNLCVSTLHASLTSIFNLYFLYTGNGSILSYQLVIGYSIGYYLDATTLKKKNGLGLGFSILYHHLHVIGFSVINYINVTLYPGYYETIISLLYLSELSTPLLNYIQYYHGVVSYRIKMVFLCIYLVCRPVNIAYVIYRLLQFLGPYHPLLLGSYAFMLLNCYWLRKIYNKG